MKKLYHSCLSSIAVIAGLLVVSLSSTAQAQCAPIELAREMAFEQSSSDWFGFSVSMDGDTAIVGAPRDLEDVGTASIYRFVDGQWVFEAKLIPFDGAEGDRFGWSVSISGSTAVVGAFFDDDHYVDSGSVYLYERVNGVWTFQTKLFADNGAEEDHFGRSVAIDDETVVVGAPNKKDNLYTRGSLYVFSRSSAGWAQTAELLHNELTLDHVGFGASVSISGNTIATGATHDLVNGVRTGAVYVFELAGTDWVQQARLWPADVSHRDWWGGSVAISGDSIIAGSYNAHTESGSTTGSAYVFTRSEGQWEEVAKFEPSNQDNDGFRSQFGWSVAIDGDLAVVGAPRHNLAGLDAGSVYLYKRSGDNWVQESQVVPTGAGVGTEVGKVVAISGETLAFGALGWDSAESENAGALFAYTSRCDDCLADLNGDDQLDFIDVSAFLTAFAANDPYSDFNADGSFDFIDVSEFVRQFANGCP